MPKPPTKDRGTRPTDQTTAEGYATALSDDIRRNLLFHLKRHRVVEFEDLVEVALATTESSLPEKTTDQRTVVTNALFHLHLPKLELLNIIDWDRETNTVTLTADRTRLDEWLALSLAEAVHGATHTERPPVIRGEDTLQVLFIEDYEPLADVLVDRFAADHPDIEVTTASNATTALAEIKTGSFDCIVSDYDMPASSGIDLLKAIRKVDANVPFVIFTGKGSPETRSEANAHGVSAFLTKRGGDAQFDLLADRIRQVVVG